MTNQQELVRQVTGKNRLSNIMLCCKIVFDLIPQMLLIHMIGLYLAASLTREHIFFECGAMLICFIGKAICAYLATWTAHKAAYTCLTDLRLQIIRHLKKLSLGFFQERKTGDLTNVVQHDVEQVEGHLAHGLPEIMSATILPAVVFLIMLWVDWRLALVMVVGLPLMWLTKKISAPLWTKNFKIYADSVIKMQENVMEYVAGISVIKAFGKEETKTEKTIQSAKDYDYWVKKSMAGISVPMGLIILFMESGVVLVMILGTYLLSVGQIELPRLILAIVLGGLFTSSIAKVATFQHYGIVFKQATKGIWSILGVSVSNRPEQSEAPVNGEIVISDLSFAYNGDDKVLENINLRFPKGSKTALVGASGSGKTTITNLLLRFWDVTDGAIRIGGVDVRDISYDELLGSVSIVMQNVQLFADTIEGNIRLGKAAATQEEIIAAAKKARIHDFIMSLPDGYQTMIGENGVGLSGGQKQRLSIARAFLKDAPILLLDEITSNVDPVNEALIQEAISELAKDRTVLVIAHHLSTIRSADQILVFQDGRIVQSGQHETLLSDSDGYYHKLWNARGSGKTTLSRCSNGLVPHFYEGTFSGEVHLNGRNTGDFALRDFGTIVGSVFQDPRSQFFMTDTTNKIAFGCVNIKLPREEVWQRTKDSLEKINISKLTDKSLFQLFSGEMQKVSIASCYAMAPDIYVFDEPSANLDFRAIMELHDVLSELKSDGKTVIVLEHRFFIWPTFWIA